jgi:hypothetical protein
MKKFTKFIGAVLLLAFVSTNLKAQDITDTDLKDYAIILLAQKSITDKISPMVNAQIAAQEGIDGKRYAELNKAAKGKIENLPADATDFEKQFYGIVQKRVDKKKKGASTVVNTLASNGLGAAKYKAIRTAIKSDSDMKAKIDGYMAGLSM